MPSRNLLVSSPPLLILLLLLLHILFCLINVATAATKPNPFLNCDPATTPCAKPEEGTPACSACSFAPHSSACQTAYNRQPAIYCGNSTMQMAQLRISAAACCPVILDATPTQCVAVDYNVTFGGHYHIESFTCRGKVLPVVEAAERPLLKTGLALVGVVAPICLILAVYALCRRYRGHDHLSELPSGETLVDEREVVVKGGGEEADVVPAVGSYEMPAYRPVTFYAEGEVVALGLSTRSDDHSGVY